MNAPNPRPATVLDASSLARLRELDPEGRHGVVARVLGAFESSLTRQHAQFVAARDAGDVAALGTLAHTLKSSAGAVGALALAAHCAELEAAVRAGNTAAVGPIVEQLLSEAQGALQAVRAMLRP